MSEPTTIQWIRPMTKHEVLLSQLNQVGCCRISYVLRISSKRAITEQDCRQVFGSLYRKTPNLRLCQAEKDGEAWFKEMDEEKIDFQVLEDADVHKAYHDIINHELDVATGPLWAARLLPWSDDQKSFVGQTSANGVENTKYPHVCHVVVMFNHYMTDGYSCMRIMRQILVLFNDVIEGNKIHDHVQIARHLDVERAEREAAKIHEKFMSDKEFRDARVEKGTKFLRETVFEKAYPVAPFLKPKTVSLTHVVDEDLNKRFAQKCKQEGVTFHTGFSTLIEKTIREIVAEKGFDTDFQINSAHMLDLRGYYDNCVNEFGYSVSAMLFESDWSANEFWAVAKNFHAKFKEEYKQKTCFDLEEIENITGEAPYEIMELHGQGAPSKRAGYYTTTNMRDITEIVGSCGESVHLEYLDRLSSVELIPFLWLNTFHTFRGRLLHALQYNSHIVDAETAQKVSDRLFVLMKSVCEE